MYIFSSYIYLFILDVAGRWRLIQDWTFATSSVWRQSNRLEFRSWRQNIWVWLSIPPLNWLLPKLLNLCPTKLCLVKAMVFPVVMNGCESWTIKKAEHWRTDAFELWCWRRLKSPLDCKEIQPVHPKGNQSWIFIGRPDAEAETPIL